MRPEEILTVYGTDPAEMVDLLLDKMDLAEMIPPHAKIGLKPNLVVSKPASSGATTHPEIAAGIIRYLQRNGFRDIAIIESSWVGDSTAEAYRVAGYTALSKEFDVPLIDLKRDTAVEVTSGNMALRVCRRALETDFLINLPVLKAHCQTRLTCALKNLKGCIPDSEKRRYHTMGLNKPIAHLAAALRPHVTIVDAICGDLSFEEGGSPVPMGRLFAGTDPVLLDSYAAHLIGLDPKEIPYIGMAASLGVGTVDLSRAELKEINPDAKHAGSFQSSRAAQSLAKQINPKDACSACFGSLIHALYRYQEDHRGKSIAGLIKIGQGYRGATGSGPGIGNCTCGLTPYLPGCPPTAQEIKEFLKKL